MRKALIQDTRIQVQNVPFSIRNANISRTKGPKKVAHDLKKIQQWLTLYHYDDCDIMSDKLPEFKRNRRSLVDYYSLLQDEVAKANAPYFKEFGKNKTSYHIAVYIWMMFWQMAVYDMIHNNESIEIEGVGEIKIVDFRKGRYYKYKIERNGANYIPLLFKNETFKKKTKYNHWVRIARYQYRKVKKLINNGKWYERV